jgi:hypothetical protein
MTTSCNDITGDQLISKTPSDSYRDGWDRIFGNKPLHVEWSDNEESEEDQYSELHDDKSPD